MTHNKILDLNWKHNMKSTKELLDKDFRYNHFYKGYVRRFPVYKHKKYTTLECYVIIYEDEDDSSKLDSNVRIEVMDEQGDFYSPFYSYNEGYKDLILSINKKIRRNLLALGIRSERHSIRRKRGE